jgi:hypothetical protein
MKRHFSLLVFFIFLVLGCESIIQVEVPYDGPKITVNGYLRPDSSIFLSITESKFILDDRPFVAVENAKVTLYEDGQDMGTISGTGNGWYTCKKKPKIGKSYRLKVETSRFGIVEAESSIPTRVGIKNFTVSNQRVQRESEQYHILEIEIDDPVEPGNYYEILLLAGVNEKHYRNDTLVWEDAYTYNVDIAFADSNLEELNSFGGASSLVFNDGFLNGSGRPLRIYAKSRQLVNLQRKDGTKYSAKEKFRTVREDFLFVILRHTDEPYYHFRRSLTLQSQNKGNPFAEPVKVFSNVKNGHGIFAGYSSTRFQVNVNSLQGGVVK